MSEPTEEFINSSEMSDEELAASICETFASEVKAAFARIKAETDICGYRFTTTLEVAEDGRCRACMEVDESRLAPVSEGPGESPPAEPKAVH
jgi:hypothetical protein